MCVPECIIRPEGVKRTQHQYIEVIIDTPVQELDRPFHYSVPEDLRDRVEIGSLVLVPFTNRMMLAYVVGFPTRPDVARIKSISRVLDEPPLFDFDAQRLCRWIAAHYSSSLSSAFRLVMPPGRSRKVKQYVSMAVDREEALGMLGERQTALRDTVEILSASEREMEMGALRRHVGARSSSSAVASLEEKGIVKRRFVLTEPAASPASRLAVRFSPDALDTFERDELPPRQRDIIGHLLAHGGMEFQSDLLRVTGASAASLKSLARKGLVEIANEELLRQPRLGYGLGTLEIPTPNDHQQTAIDRINEALEEKHHGVFLLEGVTGSGKTEVYLRAIERVLALGRSAIALVPEISLTPQTLERFSSRFPGNVAVLHSRLATGERFDQWRGIREGRYRVVVGARSALFAPLSDLGLIAIDEEHEPSYKSDTAPRYHAREVAESRARMSGAVVILGSATPSLESVEKARAGIYEHLVLPYRIDNRPLPAVEVVDMKSVGGAGEVPLVSPLLLDALVRTIGAGEQAILFLNRRGFANYLQCRACGYIMNCDECEVSLSYHRKGDMLMCHHCGKTWKVPEKCPNCGGGLLKQFGAGTQRVEEEVRKNLPDVPIIRMDTDTTTTKDAHGKLLGAFSAGEAQVLIGTQMIAKGLDIPGVTLVGVINADTALALPDFRASERTYQLLTQVSGRAGRGLRPGRVIVQTFNPEHPAIRALTGDTDAFVEAELKTRRSALYPPFVDLVNVHITSPDLTAAARSAERMRKILDGDLAGGGVTILGPAPSPLSRLRGQYRWHILLKCGDLDTIAEKLKSSVGRFYEYSKTFPTAKDVRVYLDVNPTSVL
jgi:primosomal protein N' (replication factor Y)